MGQAHRTPERNYLALLPPGSDAVRRLSLHGAWPGSQCSLGAHARRCPPRPPDEVLRSRADVPAGEPTAGRGTRRGPARAAERARLAARATRLAGGPALGLAAGR